MMASAVNTSGLAPQRKERTRAKYSISNTAVPPTKNDWDSFFQPIFDEYFKPSPNVDHLVSKVPTLVPTASTSSPSSTTIDQDAPSTSTSQTTSEQQSLIIPQGVEDDFYDIENVIGDPSRPVSTRNQLQEHAIWCYFDANDNPIPQWEMVWLRSVISKEE
nr:hypothetical protein [Tanacetum cinerariifolium]